MVFRENTTDLSRSAVPIVGGRLYNHCHSSGCITFVGNFIEMLRFGSFARAPFDGTLDIIVGHAGRARGQNGAAQSRVSARIAAASFRRDRNFLRQLAENLTAFGVNGAFEAFYLRPLAVSRHKSRAK